MGANSNKLKLECLAIGSMPHENLNDAITLIKETFLNVPFWPQMVKISKNEDMILQFLEGMPSFFYEKSYLDTEYDAFYDDLERFFVDYEAIVSEGDMEQLDKYGISPDAASSFGSFLKIIAANRPAYAKGQIVGPFTLSTTLVDKDGRCAIYDETLKEIILKTLTLKALWQVKKIQAACPGITPIIFIDEPSISQLGTSAYVTVSENDVCEMLKEVSDVIQAAGALSAIHCCGKCDWKVPLKSGVDMINLDAYSYSENLSVFSQEVENFLNAGKKIVWGVVPTLDKDALIASDLDKMVGKFEQSVKYLTKKGIDEKLVIDNSLVSTSCGAGSLTVELAEKAFRLTKDLSEKLKTMYN